MCCPMSDAAAEKHLHTVSRQCECERAESNHEAGLHRQVEIPGPVIGESIEYRERESDHE